MAGAACTPAQPRCASVCIILLQFCQLEESDSDPAAVLVVSEQLHSAPAASVDINTVRQVGDGVAPVHVMAAAPRCRAQPQLCAGSRPPRSADTTCEGHTPVAWPHDTLLVCHDPRDSGLLFGRLVGALLQVLLSVAGDGSICLVPGSEFTSASAATHTFKQASGWSGYSQGRWVDSHTFATVSWLSYSVGKSNHQQTHEQQASGLHVTADDEWGVVHSCCCCRRCNPRLSCCHH